MLTETLGDTDIQRKRPHRFLVWNC